MSRRRPVEETVPIAGTPREIAKRYRVGLERVYSLIDRGVVPAYKADFAKKRLILFSDFERWLRSTSVRPEETSEAFNDRAAENGL